METKNNLMLPIAIVLAGLIVAGAMFYTNKDQVGNKPAQNKAISSFSVAEVTDADSILGSKDAEVIVIEYSDTECPFCKSFHTTMQRVMEIYGQDNRVAWVYRHFPIDALHKKARKESVAIECAKVQGGNDMFWKYVNEVYKRTSSNDSLPEAELTKIASDLKIDINKWSSCYKGDETLNIVKAQEQSGADAGVQGTPNNFLIFKKALSDNQVQNLITAFAQYPEGILKISEDRKIVNLGGAMPYNLMTLVIDNALLAK